MAFAGTRPPETQSSRLVKFVVVIERLRELRDRGMRLVSSSPSGLSNTSVDTGATTFRRASGQADPADIGRLRRERRRLLRAREQSVRDLGGLTLEMVRRERFKPDLLKRRARDILALEDGVYDVEDALDDARQAIPDPGIGSSARCACGALNDRSTLFCAACGRSLRPAGGAHGCRQCATVLPGGARYCPSCGSSTEATHESPTGAGW